MTNPHFTLLLTTLAFGYCCSMSIDLDHYIQCQPGVQFYDAASSTCIPCRTTCPKNQYIIQLCSNERDSVCGQIKFGIFQLLSRTSTPKIRTQEPFDRKSTRPAEEVLVQDQSLYYVGIALVLAIALIGLLVVALAYMCRSYQICHSKEKKECIIVSDETNVPSEEGLFIENDTVYLIQESGLPAK